MREKRRKEEREKGRKERKREREKIWFVIVTSVKGATTTVHGVDESKESPKLVVGREREKRII